MSAVAGMQVGMRYIVTCASKNREFQVGDHIKLLADGSIDCWEAQGWMEAADVPAATEGMVVEADLKWALARSAELQKQLAALRHVES